MKKRIKALVCLLFALALTLQLCPAPAITAPSGIYMIAVNDDLMKPEQSTMPFWEGGTLYVPYTVFKGIYRESIGVSFASTVDGRTAILFNQVDALTFDLDAGTVLDNKQTPYSGAAAERNGTVFFPIDLITAFFGLTYSYHQTDVAPLIRIKNAEAALSDDRFIDAARSLMQHYYKEYEKTTDRPEDPAPADPVTVTGQWVYPVFTVTDAAAARQIADTLARWNVQGTFLMTAEQIEQEADLLRMLVGTKNAVGIRSGAADAPSAVAEADRANEALWAAARSTTRLLWIEEELAETDFSSKGYCLMDCSVDQSGRPLTNSSRADALYTRISGMATQHITVFLGSDVDNTAGLRYFLARLEAGDCRALAWRETL